MKYTVSYFPFTYLRLIIGFLIHLNTKILQDLDRDNTVLY